ncbi:MAG TPA: hypothetical protein VFZ65_19650 [Planctomycetota bacterium]|nr:hypothetical protein [Planctomycetota bacterium]
MSRTASFRVACHSLHDALRTHDAVHDPSMAAPFRRTVAPLLLLGLAGCAAKPAEAPPAMLSPAWLTMDTLADLRTGEQMRAYLGAGLAERELDHVGFDQVSLAQCIEQVVAAALDDRARPGDEPTRRRLVDAVELYLDVMQETTVRRTAGAASCLPPVR